jgi:hypothetical protein
LITQADPQMEIVDLFFLEDVPELAGLEQRTRLPSHTIFFSILNKVN